MSNDWDLFWTKIKETIINAKRQISNFDEDNSIDTSNQCYLKTPIGLSPEQAASMSDEYIYGIEDYVQPCGVTERIHDTFHFVYRQHDDIQVLLNLLETHPVYGSPEITSEIIGIIKKARIKPVPDRLLQTEKLHRRILSLFSTLNPKRSEVESAYNEIAIECGIKEATVKTIVNRARKAGWRGDYMLSQFGLNIDKVSRSDSE